MTLTDARKALGWTQERLAREAGERMSTISDIETKRNARPAYIIVMNIFRALQRGGLKGLVITDVFPVPWFSLARAAEHLDFPSPSAFRKWIARQRAQGNPPRDR